MTLVIEKYIAKEETQTATIEIEKFSSVYKLVICQYFRSDPDRAYPVRKSYYSTVKAAQQALKRYGYRYGITWSKQ